MAPEAEKWTDMIYFQEVENFINFFYSNNNRYAFIVKNFVIA